MPSGPARVVLGVTVLQRPWIVGYECENRPPPCWACFRELPATVPHVREDPGTAFLNIEDSLV